MIPLKWEKAAAENYREIMGKLPPYRQEQVDEWLDGLREWPPRKWYELREKDGVIRFHLDNDKFLKILGRFEEREGVAYITHFEWRSERRG